MPITPHFAFCLCLAPGFFGCAHHASRDEGVQAPAERASVDAPRFEVDAHSNLIIDGTPRFLLGLYHVSWIGARTGDDLAQDMRIIGEAGFDVVHPTVLPTPTADAVLKEAHARGHFVVGEVYWPERASVVERHREAPAVLAWDLADDANWPPDAPRIAPDELGARRVEFDALDPDALSYASVIAGPGLELRAYAERVELLGVLSYPIGNVPDETALEVHVDHMRQASEAASGTGACLFLNLQTFAWPDQRAPTAMEVRNMLYASIVHGFKGVLAYTFYDGDGLLPDEHPEVWHELARLCDEFDAIETVVLHGERTLIETGTAGVHGAVWTHEDERLVILLSTMREQHVSVSVPVPGVPSSREAPPVDRAVQGGMRVQGEVLSCVLGPGEVSVYHVRAPSDP